MNHDDVIEGDEPWHGKNYGYFKKNCRGPKCRAWWAAYQKEYRKKRMAITGEAFSGRRGGFVPGKLCACGCGLSLPATSNQIYKTGHRPARGMVP